MGAVIFFVLFINMLWISAYVFKFIEWMMKPHSKKTLKDFMKEL